jgi:hypothetical protein
VAHLQRPNYFKWVGLYLGFCQESAYPPTAPTALGPFLTNLAAKGHAIDQRHHAATTVRLLIRPDPQDANLYQQLSALSASVPQQSETSPPPTAGSPRPHSSPAAAQLLAGSPPAPSPHTASWEREYRDLESAIKLRNYSRRTLEAYRHWVARFQAFVRSRPTAQLSNQQVRGFLSSLAVQHGASASSQNQAFNALLFFFRHVLRRDFGQIDGVVRAKRHRYIPVVRPAGKLKPSSPTFSLLTVSSSCCSTAAACV